MAHDLNIMTLLLGGYGVGKTTLAATAPGPILFLDAEQSARYLERVVITWEPGEDFPSLEGFPEDTIVVYDVTSWKRYSWVMRKVLRRQIPGIRSIVIDSLPEMQNKLQMSLTSEIFDRSNPLKHSQGKSYDHWEALRSTFQSDITNLASLKLPKGDHPGFNITITSGVNQEVQPYKPLILGGFRRDLARLMDIEGYLEVLRDTDMDSGEIEEMWRLDIQPHVDSLCEVKCRPPAVKREWGLYITNPNLSEIIRVINENRKSK